MSSGGHLNKFGGVGFADDCVCKKRSDATSAYVQPPIK